MEKFKVLDIDSDEKRRKDFFDKNDKIVKSIVEKYRKSGLSYDEFCHKVNEGENTKLYPVNIKAYEDYTNNFLTKKSKIESYLLYSPNMGKAIEEYFGNDEIYKKNREKNDFSNKYINYIVSFYSLNFSCRKSEAYNKLRIFYIELENKCKDVKKTREAEKIKGYFLNLGNFNGTVDEFIELHKGMILEEDFNSKLGMLKNKEEQIWKNVKIKIYKEKYPDTDRLFAEFQTFFDQSKINIIDYYCVTKIDIMDLKEMSKILGNEELYVKIDRFTRKEHIGARRLERDEINDDVKKELMIGKITKLRNKSDIYQRDKILALMDRENLPYDSVLFNMLWGRSSKDREYTRKFRKDKIEDRVEKQIALEREERVDMEKYNSWRVTKEIQSTEVIDKGDQYGIK